MWKPILAFALVVAVLTVPTVATTAEGESTQTPEPPAAPASTPCTPIKAVYSERNWREAKPQRGIPICSAARAARRNTIGHFYEYRHYRQIATMRCTNGSEGYYVPNPGSCSTIACESHFSWRAANPSGAIGPYQLLGHGAPWPVRSFRDRLAHHEIAATLGRSSWVC